MPSKLPNTAQLARVVVSAGRWDDFARSCALALPGDDVAAYADFLEAETKAGRALCLHGHVDGKRAGTAWLQVRTEGGRKIAFILGGSGNVPGDAAWKVVIPVIEQTAKNLGCSLVQTATARAGIVAAYRKIGWEIIEVHLAKKI